MACLCTMVRLSFGLSHVWPALTLWHAHCACAGPHAQARTHTHTHTQTHAHTHTHTRSRLLLAVWQAGCTLHFLNMESGVCVQMLLEKAQDAAATQTTATATKAIFTKAQPLKSLTRVPWTSCAGGVALARMCVAVAWVRRAARPVRAARCAAPVEFPHDPIAFWAT